MFIQNIHHFHITRTTPRRCTGSRGNLIKVFRSLVNQLQNFSFCCPRTRTNYLFIFFYITSLTLNSHFKTNTTKKQSIKLKRQRGIVTATIISMTLRLLKHLKTTCSAVSSPAQAAMFAKNTAPTATVVFKLPSHFRQTS